ncbi:Protein of unknown function (DUF423), putative [Angomonas deanei]|uniref:Uncharacterized protein n=1 Tax=Angomonas deanei TaxID=59799 RepID=A0A7G2CIX7_9TRYP|nr:Protein of unknown function (DUF423), putative [Angomonas deanei]
MESNSFVSLKVPQLRVLGAGLLGGLGVTFGALGSHAFMPLMSAEEHKLYLGANQYHIIHSIVLYLTGFTLLQYPNLPSSGALTAGYNALFAGTVLLATCRYIHCTVHKPEWVQKLQYGVPVSSALLLFGWGSLAYAAVKL